MGIFRALWHHQTSYEKAHIIIHIPDSSLVTSPRFPPTFFASKVPEWLNKTVQLFLSPLAL